MALTPDQLLARVDRLTQKRFPDGTAEVAVGVDDWRGEVVVKASDIAALVAWVIGQLDGRARHGPS